MFDAEGRLRNWWTKADLAHFEASGARLAAQFDRYRPFPDLHVNGKQTLSENIADLAGLAAAHDAWIATLGGAAARGHGLQRRAAVLPRLRAILAYQVRDPLMRQLVVTDGHAPDPYRAQTVRNFDAWYAAFEVKPGETLYLGPTERVRVW